MDIDWFYQRDASLKQPFLSFGLGITPDNLGVEDTGTGILFIKIKAYDVLDNFQHIFWDFMDPRENLF